ncbi:MAG TPA: 16S rRNA (cytosine(967)-C(5))-methyltransferase RsmB [Rhodanobacteraceae bacterium]|nr:16S rRNA (cytosine(967)-C(5))-methyltransferase RsmB [Rhodanobacteraceae bacterium]
MNAGAALRATAARALAKIVFDGASLRAVLGAAHAKIADPRDRALLSATLFASARWWLRFDAVPGRLLQQPLPAGAREIRALLVVALVQIVVLGLPDYAVVAAGVDAARALGHSRYASLVNALLRRFLRERAALEIELDRDPVTRHAHPRWLIDAIHHDWPGAAGSILAANNREAPLTLRVNRRRGDLAALAARLCDAGFVATPHAELPDGLVLADSADVTRLPGYAEGLFSVQDGAAQRVVELLDLHDGLRVLDACAAPGGKAAHALERADLDLFALDRDSTRVPRLVENLARLGLGATVVAADAARPPTWWDGRMFDRILLDAPCSATGILRRQPDVRLHRRASDIPAFARTQAGLLSALWPLLASGGRLVYATCSVLRAENEKVMAEFLGQCADARIVELPDDFGAPAGSGRQRLPGTGGMDGFYYAIAEKR